MDAFDHGDPESSQATQMIQDLLQQDPSPGKPSGSRASALRTHSNEAEVSSDSLPSSRTSHSIPQYHFHGLASTQTQSQHYTDEEEEQLELEGSQKENIGAHGKEKEPSPPRPASPRPGSSSRTAAAKPLQASSAEKGAAGKKTTNVTFHSPRKGGPGTPSAQTKLGARASPYKATPPVVSRYKQPPRPPRRTDSQDSFAREPIDHEERLLATAEQFAIPLEDLAKRISPQAREEDTSTSTDDSMYRPRPPRPELKRRRLSPERVLVENSSQSQPESQPARGKDDDDSIYGASQPQNQLGLEHSEFADMHARAAPPPSASPPPPIHPDLLATQPSADDNLQETQPSGEFAETQPSGELEGTQPSTQVDDSAAFAFEEGATPFDLVQPAQRSTAGTSGPRSLLSMVRPENQWRYRKFGAAQNSGPAPRAVQAPVPSLGLSEVQETQPSFPEAPPPRRGFPIKSLTASTAASVPQTLTTPVVDSMDVVPDSEPARLGAQTSPRKAAVAAHTKGLAAGAAKALAKVNEEGDVEMKAADAGMSDDEEEVPLMEAVAAAAPAKRGRGRPPGSGRKTPAVAKKKEVAPAAPPPPAPAAKAKPKATNPPVKAAQKAAIVPGMLGRSWETGEVPSSVPEQDFSRNVRNTRNRPAIIPAPKKTPAPKGPQSKQSTRSTSNAPRSRSRQQEEEEEPEDAAFAGEEDIDECTEPADEEYQDADVPMAGPSRKRKRASLDKTGVPVKGTRGTVKRTKRTNATPATRGGVKAAASTVTRSAAGAQGSRVFALWMQDGHYYPGTVHSTDNNARYNIRFDDDTEGWIGLDDMRALELRVGDGVLFADRNRPAEIANVDNFKNGTVEVLIDDEVEERPISEILIAHKTIMHAWDDRRMTAQTVSTTVKPVKKQVSPSPSKMSMVSVPSVRGKSHRVLARTALIVTLGVQKDKWEKGRGEVLSAVRNSGATVIDNMNEIIAMEGKHAAQNNRWTIRKQDAKWIGSAEIGRLFLLADDANQKPKFLIALALGIPCLSTMWLHDSVECGKEREWAGYLLPQGYSAHLRARASQQVDVDWGNSIHYLNDIMNNRVTHKLFAEMSILCIGQDMVCPPKSKRKALQDDKALEASNSVPRIILAMGAEVVEAVTESRHASKDLSSYDYIVIREPSQYSPIMYAGCTVVHWAWVKDCLIASRFLPLPTWPEIQDSQEA